MSGVGVTILPTISGSSALAHLFLIITCLKIKNKRPLIGKALLRISKLKIRTIQVKVGAIRETTQEGEPPCHRRPLREAYTAPTFGGARNAPLKELPGRARP